MAGQPHARVTHPRHDLDDLLGHPVRFSIVAMLAPASKIEFSFVRDQLEISDSMLSKQVSALEQAGYVKVDKGFVGKRGRTWLSITRVGRSTFERHLAALRRIAGGADPALVTNRSSHFNLSKRQLG